MPNLRRGLPGRFPSDQGREAIPEAFRREWMHRLWGLRSHLSGERYPFNEGLSFHEVFQDDRSRGTQSASAVQERLGVRVGLHFMATET